MTMTTEQRARMIDPPVRPDGVCARHGCKKQRNPERSVKYGGLVAESDPFCSTECCRDYYGCSTTKRASDDD